MHGRDDHARHCDLVETEAARLLEAAGCAGPDEKVPTCPGWSVADLLRHVGTTHRWVTFLLRTGARERVRARDVVTDVPACDAALPCWVADGVAVLLDTLRTSDPAGRVWTVFGTEHRVAFWSRRMAYELTVHRADVELALRRRPSVDPAVALAGIDELFGCLSSARWVLDRLRADVRYCGERIRLVPTDAADPDRQWLVTRTPDGFRVAAAPYVAQVTVHGAASDLLLLGYGRLPATDPALRLTGDPGILDRWLAATAF